MKIIRPSAIASPSDAEASNLLPSLPIALARVSIEWVTEGAIHNAMHSVCPQVLCIHIKTPFLNPTNVVS